MLMERSGQKKVWSTFCQASSHGNHSPAVALDSFDLSYSLNSLKGDYIGGNMGDYYRGY